MDTQLMEYLLILEKEENLTRAADKIHISPSALSQRVSKLEQSLQVPLFERSDKKWNPTAAGRCYLDGARKMIRIRQETYEKIRRLSNAGSRCIRLALCSQVYYLYSEQIRDEVQRTFPGYQLELHRTNSVTAAEYLINGSVDGAIVSGSRIQLKQLTLRPLYHEKMVLAVPEEMAWDGSEIDWDQFLRCPLIMPSNQSTMRQNIDSALKDKNLLFSEFHETGSVLETLYLMERGYGVAFLPERITKRSQVSCSCRSYPWNPTPEYDIEFAYSDRHPDQKLLGQIYELFYVITGEDSYPNSEHAPASLLM